MNNDWEFTDLTIRTLCYAINQNLSKHRSWSLAWMKEWARDSICAIDRLNNAAYYGRALPIKPYAEGFMPLTAILCHIAYTKRNNDYLPKTIDTVIAVTNFVKFSKSDSASSSEIPDSWWKECGHRYVQYEIEILKPDIIVTFGKKTYLELGKVLSSMNNNKLQIMDIRFPGRIPSEKSRPIRGRDRLCWIKDILPLTSRIESPSESFVSWRMTRFPGYFLDISKALNIF